MAPTRRWLALTAFVALIAGAGGVSAGILITSPPTPASLASSSAPSTVPVTTREFTDTRSLILTIPPASPHELTSPIAGRITALQAAPGTPITSGSIPCEIDGLPLLALALSTPLYQDVVDGATGPDIAALNAELARLGYAAPAESNRVTASTRAALASAMGVSDGAGGVPSRIEASHVLWIPAPTVTPSSVPVHLGDSVDTQTVLLALEDSRDSLRLSVPPDAYPADHVITLGGTDYPVPSDGVITDPTLTATILSSREYHPAGLSDRRRDERVRLCKRHADPRLHHFLSAWPNLRPAIYPALHRRHRRRGTLMSVELDNVGHKFAASPWLFRHLSARCEDGTLTAIIGPSGSGKSTLLSLIAGWDTPTEGTITVPCPVGTQSPRIAWVFQNPFGVRARSAIDHVALPLLARGMSRAQAEAEAHRLLDAFNLAHLATRPFRDLSGGEAQRVLLARGLACAPTLLLVDEPTAQLDQSTARDIASTLGSLREDGVSVVIATHDPSIRAQCDAVIDLAHFQDEEEQQ